MRSLRGIFVVMVLVSGLSLCLGGCPEDEAPPKPPTADFEADPLSGLVSLSVEFTDLSTGKIDEWEWDFGDGDTSSQQHPTHTYADAGAYTVKLTVTGPGGDDTEEKVDYITVYEPVVADFEADPTDGPAPLEVAFTDNSSGDITSWAWDFGDSGTSTDQDPTHTYADAGTYTVKLTVSGPGGDDTEEKTDYITVTEAVVAEFEATPLTGPIPLAVVFTDESIGDITSWAWDFGDGGTSADQNPDHTYAAAGTYTVKLTVSGPAGNATEEKTDYITAYDVVVADFEADPLSGPPTLEVTFTDKSSGATSWSWDFGDSGTSADQNPTHTYNTTGKYTVKLTVSGPGGADAEEKVDYITVAAPPVAAFTGTPTSGIAPFDVAFTNSSTGDITTYLWDFGDGETSPDESPTHTYSTPGVHTVKLTVTGPGGTDAEEKVDYITVYAPAVAAFVGTPTSGSPPLVVTFTNNSTGDIDTYLWDFGDGTTSTDKDPAAHSYNAGTYTVKLTVSGDGGSDTEEKTDYITVSAETVAVTVTTGIGVGTKVIVDSVDQPAPYSATWVKGSTHTIDITSPQSGAAGVQYLFVSWSDAGTQQHDVAPSVNTTYTAALTTQYRLTTAVAPPGSGTIVRNPDADWYNAGGAVDLTPQPDPAYKFEDWSGDATGSAIPLTITMSAPKSVTANFTTQPPFIDAINPTVGGIGAEVTIAGANFTGTEHTVKFHSNLTAAIISWTNTKIVCIVPALAMPGDITVTTPGGTSNGVYFTVIPTPEVLSTDPVDGATINILYPTISVLFDSNMDHATINSHTFYLSNGVAGIINYDGPTKTATLDPVEGLTPSTTYTVTLTTDITNDEGTALAADYTFSFSTTIPTGSDFVFVDCDYTGGDSNGTAVKPYTTINDGIDNAGTKDVIVAEGTYNEEITISADVKIYGGFGGVGAWADRTTRSSIITPSLPTAVSCTLGITGETVIDGFTLNGATSGAITCGVSCSNAHPIIRDNKISAPDGTNGYGIICDLAGPTINGNSISAKSWSIYNKGGSSPSITRNIVEDSGILNEAAGGTIADNLITTTDADKHGIYCDSLSGNGTKDGGLSIENNIIETIGSGAVGVHNRGNPEIYDNIITTAGDGAYGIENFIDKDTEVEEVIPDISGNSITTNGNGAHGIENFIHNEEDSEVSFALAPNIQSNIITTNGDSSHGIENKNLIDIPDVAIVETTNLYPGIYSNYITVNGNETHGIGNLFLDPDETEMGALEPYIASNLILATSATAETTRGVSCSGGTAYICDNTIDGGKGGTEAFAIYLENYASPTIANNILMTGIGSKAQGYGIYEASADADPDWVSNNCFFNCPTALYLNEGLTAFHEIVAMEDQLNSEGTSSGDNIKTDPLFVGGALFDYRLQDYSPCVDAGDNGLAGSDQDLDLKDRFVDGDRNGSGIIDIGAYERQIIVLTETLPDGVVELYYEEHLRVTSNAGPYNWTIFTGSLPDGLNLDSSGIIFGTPLADTKEGDSTFIVEVEDGNGVTIQKEFTLTVHPEGDFVITTNSLPYGVTEEDDGTLHDYLYSDSTSVYVYAAGGTTYVWSITGGALPEGLDIDPDNGEIYGTPTAAEGIYNFKVKVKDGVLTGLKDLSIKILKLR